MPYYDLENYYDENKIVRIPADVMLTPSQNSQKYYKEYRKNKLPKVNLMILLMKQTQRLNILKA